MEWHHLFHYLGYITVEHVDCQRSQTIPLEDEIMELVAKSLERYDMFRIGEGDSSWKRHSRIKKAHHKTSGSSAVAAGVVAAQTKESPIKEQTSVSETGGSPYSKERLYQSWITTMKDMSERMASNVMAWKEVNNPDYEVIFFDGMNWNKKCG